MKKYLLLIISIILYVLGPVLSLVAELSIKYQWGIHLFDNNIGLFKMIQQWEITILCVFIGIGFAYGFYKVDALKYRLSDLAGMIGIVASLISLAVLPYFPVFVWVFVVSGIFCFYSYYSPLITGFYNRMGGNSWEKAAVTGVISFALIYWIGFEANIKLSEIFLVDPKHFVYTKILAGLVVVSPFVLVFSFLLILLVVYKLTLIKDGEGKKAFYLLNGLFSSLVSFVLSFVLFGGGGVIITNVASVLDFNPRSICKNVDEEYGVIYLDPVYDLVLVNQKVSNAERNIYTDHCDK